MTAPRQILPGTCYLITRRCTQRQLLLRPSKVANEVFAYLLALASQRFGVDVHAYCVLSNHYHLVVTDRAAHLPAFQQFLDGLVARAMNALLGRWEAFWSPDSYSAVALPTPDDVVDKVAYVLANPVAAGLVRRARKWPGLWSSPEAIGAGCLHLERPRHFFDERGGLPPSFGLELKVPPGFATAREFRERVDAGLAEREAAAARAIPAFLGARRVLAQRPCSQPRSREPRRALSPRVASRYRLHRVEWLARLRTFLDSYRDALHAWQQGERSVLFPAGTYLMRVAHGVPCAAAG